VHFIELITVKLVQFYNFNKEQLLFKCDYADSR